MTLIGLDALLSSHGRCRSAVSGQVISTSVGDAFPAEFHGSGNSKTIDLRYDADNPTAPYKQSNYMPLPTFLVLLAFGCLLLLWGGRLVIQADRLAQRYNEGPHNKPLKPLLRP